MAAAHRPGEEGSEHGADGAFVFRLRKNIRAEPLLQTALVALLPLAMACTIETEMLEFIIEDRRPMLEATLLREQIGGSFWIEYAIAIFLYTIDEPKIYKFLNSAMHATDREVGPGNVSPMLRACMPFIKFLDAALEALPSRFHFTGRVNRGVKWAYPTPQTHDPEATFAVDSRFYWYEFKSAAQDFAVMHRDVFCGDQGPRTIFTILACNGYRIQPFSQFPTEAEILFRPLAQFVVVSAQKRLLPEFLQATAPKGGFPDEIVLKQLPPAGGGGGGGGGGGAASALGSPPAAAAPKPTGAYANAGMSEEAALQAAMAASMAKKTTQPQVFPLHLFFSSSLLSSRRFAHDPFAQNLSLSHII